jgi:DNA-binding protein HU-beta
LTGIPGLLTRKKAEKWRFFRILPFTSTIHLPYDEFDQLRERNNQTNSRSNVFEGRIGESPMAEATRMTQTQIIKELAETTGVGNKVAKQFLESFAEIAVRETKKKGVFVMPGIGRLVRVERKARTGRNPATGESIKIPAKKVVKFRIAKAVKDAIVPPKVKK